MNPEFYRQTDVLAVAKGLLGKALFTRSQEGALTGGIILETEGYAGVDDRASHAYGGRRTPRTEVMYQAGGVAYVYLCYGIHHLLNAVTNVEGVPHAVLIRALLPTVGIETMRARRGNKVSDLKLSSGPGSLCQALGITLECNGASLCEEKDPKIWVADIGVRVKESDISTTPRIGVAYAGKDAALPYRFILKSTNVDFRIDLL